MKLSCLKIYLGKSSFFSSRPAQDLGSLCPLLITSKLALPNFSDEN